jgi:hypothetical protein
VNDNTVIIDVVAQVTDNTATGAASSIQNVSKVERTLSKLQGEITKLGKMSKVEITMYAVDKASKGINSVLRKGYGFASKVFSATVSVIDKVTAPIRGMISRIGDLIGITSIATTVLGGLTVANALSASAAQARAEVQLSTVLRNTNDNAGNWQQEFDRISRHADELQQRTMYGNTALMAGAGELATYLTDTDAIMKAMTLLTNYAAGMSGGVQLTDMQMVDYATQLGKALNAEDALFDGLRKKGFTISEMQQDILRSADTTDWERIATLSEIIDESWAGIAENFAKTATGRQAQVRNNWSNMMVDIGQRLEPSVTRFWEMIDDKMPKIRGLFTQGAEGLGGLFDRLIPSIGNGIDAAIDGINRFADKVSSITNMPEFQGAGFFGKIRILWDEIIWNPFVNWWNTKGKAALANIAHQVGRGIGNAIKWGISALFGLDAGGAIDDGLNIGRSFAQGFTKGIEGIDWNKVVDGLVDALKSVMKLIFSNPVTGTIAGLWLGGKVLGGISGGYKAYQGLKGVGSALFGKTTMVDGVMQTAGGLFPGISQGLAMKKAAAAGGPAAQSALTFARAGQMGMGAKIGSAGIGGMMLGGAGIAGGVMGAVGLIDATTDLIRGLRADDERERRAYTSSAAWKGGGVLAGAAAGAAIGSVIPVIGTLVGAGLGAGIGYIGGKIMGDRQIKKYEEEMRQAEEAARKLRIQQEQARYSSLRLRTAVQDLADGYITAQEFMAMRQAEINAGISRRFGQITLSMREVNNLAGRITFAHMRDGMEAFAEASQRADNAIAQVRRSGNELNRMNWMASIGLGFVEPEDYIAAIDAFVADVTEYLQSREYEIVMGSRLLLGDGYDGSNLRTVFERLQKQVDDYGIQIILEYDVEEPDYAKIADLQNKIMEVVNRVSSAEYEGNLSMLQIRFRDADLLDENTYNSLVQQLESNAAEAREALTRAYASAFTGLHLEFGEGLIDKATFDLRFSQLEEAYKTEMTGIDQRISDFLVEQIGAMFDMEASTLTDGMQRSILQGFNPATWTNLQARDFLGLDSLEDSAAAQIAQMVNRLAATIPTMWNVPEHTGRQSHFYGMQSGNPNSPYFSQSLTGGWQQGTWRPPGQQNNNTSSGITISEADRTAGIFRQGDPSTAIQRAEGGYFNTSHYAEVAEDGPEVIIPVGAKRRQRGLSLWRRAGAMLGINDSEPVTPMIPATSYGGSGTNGGVVVPVTVEGVTLEVHFDGESTTNTETIVQVLKANIKNLTDEIAHSLAISLQQVFANLPLAAEGG